LHTHDESSSDEAVAEVVAPGPAGAYGFELAASAPGRPSAAAVLALQRAAGNRATAGVMRQFFPNKGNTPAAQTGPPPRLSADVAFDEIRDRLSVSIDKEQSAKSAFTTLWGVSPPEDRARLVQRLDAAGLMEVLIERLPSSDVRSGTFVGLLALRGVEKNTGLAKKLLTRGWLDWEVTDHDAESAAALLDAVPEEDRKVLYEGWMGKELKENLPGTEDYEPAIGREILEGAILGDFDETPTLWSSISQAAVGFIPYAGQVADMRDTVAALRTLEKANWVDGWAWAQLVLTLIGWVPGLGDIIKGVGKAVLKWVRKGGKTLVSVVLKKVFKGIIEPGLKAVLEPLLKKWIPEVRRLVKEFMERYSRKAAEAAESGGKVDPPPVQGAAPSAAQQTAKGAAKALDEAAEKSLERSVKGGSKAVGDVLDELIDGVREALKGFADKAFKKQGGLDPASYPWPGIEGDWLVIYGKGSTVRLVRVRISAVKEFAVKQTEKLLELTAERADKLEKARNAATEALEHLIRKGAIDITEEIGERVAVMLVKKEFGQGVKQIYRGTGKGVVDLVFEDGKRIIVCEAKGGTARLGFREVGPGVKAQQGTLTYLDDIISNMKKSGDPEAVKIAKQLAEARKDDLVTYVISKTGKLDDRGDSLAAVLSWIRQ
jgi:hypothetical protein